MHCNYTFVRTWWSCFSGSGRKIGIQTLNAKYNLDEFRTAGNLVHCIMYVGKRFSNVASLSVNLFYTRHTHDIHTYNTSKRFKQHAMHTHHHITRSDRFNQPTKSDNVRTNWRAKLFFPISEGEPRGEDYEKS